MCKGPYSYLNNEKMRTVDLLVVLRSTHCVVNVIDDTCVDVIKSNLIQYQIIDVRVTSSSF